MPKFNIDEDLVRKLAGLLQETGLDEIEFEQQDQRIRVSRNAGVAVAAAPTVAVPAAGTAAPAAAPAAAGDVTPPNAVTAPMVGTAYVASEPGAPPFVKVGDTVEKGQTLLIIEAMKVMNPLPSPRAGKVTQVLVNDGEPVEFDEPLMVIE